MIFKWAGKDVVPGGGVTAETLLPVLSPYLDADMAARLWQRPLALKFMAYDWTLNDVADGQRQAR